MATFENDIEKKLGGFELHPSAHVWQGVEASLHEKKKRRFAIWWWMPLAGLLLLGFGWWAMMGNEKKDGKVLADATVANKKEAVVKEYAKNSTETVNKITDANNQQEKELSGGNNLALQKPIEKDGNSYNIIPSQETIKQRSSANTSSKTAINKKEEIKIAIKLAAMASSTKTNGLVAANTNNKQPETPASKTAVNVIDEQKENSVTAKETSSSKTIVASVDSLVKSDSNNLVKNSKTVITTDSSLAKERSSKLIAKSKQKNSWYFAVGGGASFVQGNNFLKQFLTGDEKAAEQSSSPIGSAGSGSGPTSGVGSSTGNANYPLPKTGFSFLIGAGHEWSLSKRWQLNAGLQYRYIQNKQQLSMMGISNFSGASALPSQVSNYSHSLELPVNISYAINPSSKTKFKLIGGGSMALPVSQKWLITPAYGNYYYDQSRKSKIIANANAGISMQMKTGYQFLLMAEQSLTSIHKNNNRNYYWQQYSLQVQLPFTKIFKPKP